MSSAALVGWVGGCSPVATVPTIHIQAHGMPCHPCPGLECRYRRLWLLLSRYMYVNTLVRRV